MATPFLLFVGTPAEGHFAPLRAIAKALHHRGYDCSFLTTTNFRPRIEELGIKFIGHTGIADHIIAHRLDGFPKDKDPTDPKVVGEFLTKKFFISPLSAQSLDIQRALEMFREQDPERPVVIFTEPGFLGILPMLAGAPGLRASVISIGVVPLSFIGIDSVSCGGPGEIPDFTPASRERIKAANKFIHEVSRRDLIVDYQNIMQEMQANKKQPTFFFDDCYLMPDCVMQMCSPSVEYPRTDMPSHVRFVGSLQPGHRDAWVNHPAWWPEVRDNKQKKRIIFVSQGTIFINYTQLLIPTMEAFKDSSDTIVIAALGVKGTSLPPNVEIPKNCYVEDFIPYDDILPVVDAFVMNSGYGGFQHGLQHGIPLVMAGGGAADKAEVGARGEWSGVGFNMKKITPTAEEVRAATETVLADPKYKKRALELQAEARSYDPIENIIKGIPEIATKLTVQ
jgi:UDP:flavonoid glycosyltransferase YjiC (YdhE family)